MALSSRRSLFFGLTTIPMQNRSAILIFTILLALACLYQLSFSYFTSEFENKAAVSAQGKVDSISTADGSLTPAAQDSLFDYYEARYIRQNGNEEIYPLLGYTYFDCEEKEIKKGLDLEGGMSVTLEVSIPEMIINLADNNKSESFRGAIAKAKDLQRTETDSYIDLFARAWSEDNEAGKLWQVFHTRDNKTKFPANISDDEVIEILKTEAEAAVANTEKILRTRIDKFGVTQPTIQRQQFSDRILVELPGAKDKERVRKLLKSTANLEFWELYDNTEMGQTLSAIDQRLSEVLFPEERAALIEEAEGESVDSLDVESVVDTTDTALEVDTTEVEEVIDDINDILDEDTAAVLDNQQEFSDADRGILSPLNSVLIPNIGQVEGGYQYIPGGELGYASKEDTARVNQLLGMPAAKEMLPLADRIKFRWGAQPVGDGLFPLYALKVTTRNGKPRLDGNAIVDARQDFRQFTGQAVVLMQMDSDGAKVWKAMTAEAASTQPKSCIAVVLDELVYTAPRVNEEIPSGNSEITVGGDTQDDAIREAVDLANLLKAGALPAPADIVDEQVIGPSLGKENIDKGLMSFLIALVVILFYMIFYYRGAGIVSDIALVANMFFLLGALASIGASLTLPGIAGIILTIGMAVDANVLIFERVKEELRAGAGLNAAMNKGYQKAYSAIVDANITTLFTALVLAFFGTGPIKGFATTLIIGIFTSLFSAIFLTRLIFSYRLDKKKPISFSSKMTEKLFTATDISFIPRRKIFYGISALIIIAGIGSFATRGLDLGVDFAGGRTYEISFEDQVSPDQVRDALDAVFIDADGRKASTQVKSIGTTGQKVKITTNYLIDSTADGADQMVDEALVKGLVNVGAFDSDSVESKKVDPTISDDFKYSSTQAIIFALMIIFLYIAVRFRRWQFGVGALVAMAHDVLVVLGLFSIFWGILPFSLEIDQAFIAAILTVVGYSINDTVVVFDRIREYLNERKRGGSKVVINAALNSTLSRTVNTSLSTFIVLFMIFLFGSDSIKGFTFALMVGVIVGTYSSLCIATPLVVDLTKKDEKEA
jgi:SecD/SecF fusion protein